MKCPRCSAELRAVQAQRGEPATADRPVVDGDIRIDRCDGCRGTWYDHGELEALTGEDPARLGPRVGDVARRQSCASCGAVVREPGAECAYCDASLFLPCPRCASNLRELRLAGITVELCPACHGLWLDEGEAQAIAAALFADGKPIGAITCTSCGKSGLAIEQTMCSADGLVCDACGLEAQEAEMQEWKAADERASRAAWGHSGFGGASLIGLLLAGLFSD